MHELYAGTMLICAKRSSRCQTARYGLPGPVAEIACQLLHWYKTYGDIEIQVLVLSSARTLRPLLGILSQSPTPQCPLHVLTSCQCVIWTEITALHPHHDRQYGRSGSCNVTALHVQAGLEMERSALQARLEEALSLDMMPRTSISTASPVDNVLSMLDGLLKVGRPLASSRAPMQASSRMALCSYMPVSLSSQFVVICNPLEMHHGGL